MYCGSLTFFNIRPLHYYFLSLIRVLVGIRLEVRPSNQSLLH